MPLGRLRHTFQAEHCCVDSPCACWCTGSHSNCHRGRWMRRGCSCRASSRWAPRRAFLSCLCCAPKNEMSAREELSGAKEMANAADMPQEPRSPCYVGVKGKMFNQTPNPFSEMPCMVDGAKNSPLMRAPVLKGRCLRKRHLVVRAMLELGLS